MTGPHTNKEYTAADIERYHNGSMPAEEAHALERAALDDPFLADAIDGYVHTATPVADVQFLKQQLHDRSGKVIALTKRSRSTWLRVAAMVILLAGFGWMIYKLSGKTEYDYDVAVRTDAAPRSKAQPMPQQPAADSVAAGLEETAATTQMQNQDKEKAVAKKGTTAKEAPGIINREAASNPIIADTTAFLETQEAAPLAMKAMAKQAPAHTFKARVVDTSGNPVPFATVYDPKRNTAIQVSDDDGTVSFTAPDSTITISVNATGFQAQQTKLNSNDSNATVALLRSESQLSEVVVTAQDRKTSNLKKARVEGARQNKVRLEAVEPLQDWKRLHAYVAENITKPEDKTKAFEKGEVVLSFDVDKRGNAIDIIVEKPLCAACDSTAVRLIEQGSKWKKKQKATRAKAYIRF